MRRDLNRDPNRIIHSLKEEEPDIGSRRELYHWNDSEFDRRSGCAIRDRYIYICELNSFSAVVPSSIVYVIQRMKEVVVKFHSRETCVIPLNLNGTLMLSTSPIHCSSMQRYYLTTTDFLITFLFSRGSNKRELYVC